MKAKIRKKMVKTVKLAKRMTLKQPRLKFVYGWHYKHSPINEHQILFESFHGKDISDSPLYILTEFLKMEESKNFTIYFATNNYETHKKFIDSIGLKVKLVDISTYQYTKVLATSKYLINNSSFPAYFIRREGQIYLQTWHGTPLKTLGKKMRFGIESMYNVQHNFLQANYILFPNDFTRDVMMEDYNLNSLFTGKVIMNGYPRNSIFMDHAKADEICKKLGNESYTTLAYMPTWRGQSNYSIQTTAYNDEINKMLKYLDDNMAEHQKLYVNFHPIVQKSVTLDNYKHIYPFPNDVDKYEFLNSIDALITDYSSVFFDYSVTRKPIILFMYDYEQYMHDRGMYFDIKELPFRKIYDIEALKDCIVSEDFRQDTYADNQDYIQKFIQYDSIDASKKVAEFIFHGVEGDIPIINYEKNKEKERNVILPPSIKTPETLDAVAGMLDKEKDIVIFEKKFFNPTMSSYLHDNYPDSFDYIFITRTLPRTFLEDVLKKKSQKVRERLHAREIKRCFVDLNINPIFQEEYYHGMQGENFYLKNIPVIDIPLSVEDNHLVFDYQSVTDFEITKILVVNRKRNIFWSRDLSETERSSKKIRENFETILLEQLVNENGRYLIALETRDKETGKASLCYPSDQKQYEEGLSNIEPIDKSALYLQPLFHDGITFQKEVLQEDLEEPIPEEEIIRKEIAVAPYFEQKQGRTSILISEPKTLLGKYARGQIVDFNTKGSIATFKLKMKKQVVPIKDVRLSYRDKVEDISFSMNYQFVEDNGYWIIDASIDMSAIALKPTYWDVYVILEQYDHELRLSPYLNKWQKLRLRYLKYQCAVDSWYESVPYRTKGGKLAYTYRLQSKQNAPKFDTTFTIQNNQWMITYPEDERFDFLNLIIVNGKGTIFWSRELSDSEITTRNIVEDFRAPLDEQLISENGRYLIALEAQDKKTGRKFLYYPSNKQYYQEAISHVDAQDQSALYLDPIFHKEIESPTGVVLDEMALVPYFDKNQGRAALLVTTPANMLGKYARGQVLNFKTKGSIASVKIKLKKQRNPIKDVRFSYRSKVEDIAYSMDYTVKEKNNYWIIDASIDMTKISLQELYWDIYVVIEQSNHEFFISPYLSKPQKLALRIMNYQCTVDEEHIIFPYRTKGGKLAFSYRVTSKYDGSDTRFKEFAAFGLYALLRPYWKRKRLWLVYEKFCSMAQDNGYYFFKYCMEQLPEHEKKHIFFILDKDSPDWDKMQEYRDHIIPFMSFKHILYCLVAKLYIASDSKTHLYVWRAKPNLISQQIAKHNILFLQHGVTALKRVDGIFGKRGTSPMTYFATTSEFEQKIVVENFKYPVKKAPILGFTRWDVLEDTSTKDEKIILAMPTWRSWLEEKSADEFRQSDYYKNYMTFLQTEKLGRILKEHNVKLIFYIHPKFKDYLSEFNISSDHVELIPFGSTPLNEIMKKCSMLITDYSSVCWDVYYLGKPVLFYQFDCDMYMQAHGSYLDMEHELFGDRYMECDQLIDGIEEYILNDFQEKEQYGEMRDYYFAYRDNNNSKRTYEYIIKMKY